MRKLVYLLLIVFLLLPINSFAQSSQQVTNTQEALSLAFEKIVVKEHFNTKKEMKDYIDKQALELEKTANQMIINSFNEFNNVVDKKINKLIAKLIIGIFGVIIFSQAIWYWIKFNKDKKFKEIMKDLEQEQNKLKAKVETVNPKNHIESNQTLNNSTHFGNTPFGSERKDSPNLSDVPIPSVERAIFFNSSGDFQDITTFMPIASLKANKKQILKDMRGLKDNLKPKDVKLFRQVWKSVKRL